MATNKRNYWRELSLKDRAQFYPYFIEQGITSPKDIANIFNGIYDSIYPQDSEIVNQQDIYSQWDNYFDAVNKINREKNRVEGHPGLHTLVDYSPNIPQPTQELPRDYFWRKEREALNDPNRYKLELYGNGGNIYDGESEDSQQIETQSINFKDIERPLTISNSAQEEQFPELQSLRDPRANEELVYTLGNWLNHRRAALFQNIKNSGYDYSMYNFMNTPLFNLPYNATKEQQIVEAELERQLGKVENAKFKEQLLPLFTNGLYSPKSNEVMLSTVLGKDKDNLLKDVIKLHEFTHALGHNSPQEEVIKKHFAGREKDKYLDNPSEIYARLMTFRKLHNIDPSHIYTKEDIQQLRKEAAKDFDDVITKPWTEHDKLEAQYSKKLADYLIDKLYPHLKDLWWWKRNGGKTGFYKNLKEDITYAQHLAKEYNIEIPEEISDIHTSALKLIGQDQNNLQRVRYEDDADFFRRMTDEDILFLLNEVASNDTPTDLSNIAAYGGELPNEASTTSVNEVKKEIEQLWPSAKRFGKALPDYQLKHDPNYKGYGNIEYFREPGIYYDQTGHMEMNPFGGFNKGIVYNDDTNTDDIKLDLLHHYWTVDPEYRKLWENYVASQENSWGDFMYNGAGEQFPEPYPQKDKEEFFRNGVDASLRDLLAADDNRASYNTKEGAEKQWLSTKAARDAFSELKEYLEREPSAKAYGGNLYGLGSWVNKGIGKLRQLVGWKKPIDNNSTSGYEWSDDQITDIAKAFETYQNKAYIGVKGDVLGGYGHKMTKDEIGKYWDSEKQEAKETIPDRVIQGWLKSDMDTAFNSVDTYYGKDIPSNIRAALAALSFQGGDKLIRGKRDDAGNIVDSWGGSPNFERAVKAYIKDNSQDNLNAIFNQMQYKDDNKSNMRGLSSRYGLYRAIVENIADPKKVQEYKDSATFNLYRSNKTK